MLAPALLRSLLDQQQMVGEYAGSMVAERQPRRAEGLIQCTCCRRSQSAFSSRKESWSQLCPTHNQNERTALLFKRWTFCNRLLGYSIQLSLNITKGAGGFSIAPLLEFRAIVPMDSPIFRLLFNAEKGLRSGAAGPTLEQTRKNLLEFLREGKGSCLDTLSDGNTILHVSRLRF